jgi:excisionase family DNA binding protein
MYMTATKKPISLQEGGPQRLELYTVKEACDRLRISPWSLYRLLQQRQLASIRIGRRRFIPAAAIRTFIKQRSEDVE